MATQYNNPEYKRLARLRAQARHAAVRRLIGSHAREFADLHAEERESRGLGQLSTVDSLKARIADLEAELEAMKK